MSDNFLAQSFIEQKRDKKSHSIKDIEDFVSSVTNKQIEDYQISAWLMAALLNGLDQGETSALTVAMSRSGKTLHWNNINPAFMERHLVDKHSTGGVGDKVSLILAPLAASMGMTVPMMSGRGLAQTGGTVDKLLSIPGFNMDIGIEQMSRQLLEIGTCMIRQTNEFCPADKKLYALRDVTGTVPSVSLITASILSKKVAEGVNSLIIDLKTGKAAFMKTIEQARELARSLVRVGNECGVKTRAILTKMDAPLGNRVGNSLEVIESLEILKQSYPSDIHKGTSSALETLCVDLCAEMALVSRLCETAESAKKLAWNKLRSGEAYEKFLDLCHAQGATNNWEKNLPTPKKTIEITSNESGYIASIDALKIGWLGVELGVGRAKAEDNVDPAAGFEFCVKEGDKVSKGDLLAYIHIDNKLPEKLEDKFLESITFEDSNKTEDQNLILERIYEV